MFLLVPNPHGQQESSLEKSLAGEEQGYTRMQVIDAFKEFPGERTLSVLMNLVKDERDPEVCLEAANAVMDLGGEISLARQLAHRLEDGARRMKNRTRGKQEPE